MGCFIVKAGWATLVTSVTADFDWPRAPVRIRLPAHAQRVRVLQFDAAPAPSRQLPEETEEVGTFT
eukprot:201439-Pyramimonas_sp.AAC.1